MNDTLQDMRADTLAAQWSALEPVMNEALNPQYAEDAPNTPAAPGRSIKIAQGLHIRRELTRTGWILRFSGREAKIPGLMDDIMEHIERNFSAEH